MPQQSTVDAAEPSLEERETSRLTDLLRGLGASGVYASVYRLSDEGHDEEFCPGKLTIRDGEEEHELLERLANKHGPGRYRLQFRGARRGTMGNVEVCIAGSAHGRGQEPQPAPRDTQRDEYFRLLTEQNKMLLEAITQRTPPPPAAAPAAAELEQLFKLARQLMAFNPAPAAGVAGVPAGGWMEAIAAAAGPALAEIGRAVAQTMTRPPVAVRPRIVMDAPSSPATPAPQPSSAPQGSGPAEPTPPASEDDQADAQEETTAAVAAMLTAALRAERPDPALYAQALIDLEPDQLREQCRAVPAGGIAAAIAGVAPPLASKGDFLQQLERIVRERLNEPGPS